MKVNMTVRVDIAYGTKAEDLLRALSSVPSGAKVGVTETKGTAREPGESYITLRWTEER